MNKNNYKGKSNKRQQITNSRPSQSDLKTIQTGLATFSIISGNVQHCTPCQVGPSYNERIANKITVQRLEFNYIVRAGPALIGSSQAAVRVVLVKDTRQVDSVFPLATDVFSIALPNAQYNYFNLGRFKVLYDTIHVVDVYNPTVAAQRILSHNFPVKYSSNALGSITMNGVYLLLLTDNTANAPTFDYSLRLYFTDS